MFPIQNLPTYFSWTSSGLSQPLFINYSVTIIRTIYVKRQMKTCQYVEKTGKDMIFLAPGTLKAESLNILSKKKNQLQHQKPHFFFLKKKISFFFKKPRASWISKSLTETPFVFHRASNFSLIPGSAHFLLLQGLKSQLL